MKSKTKKRPKSIKPIKAWCLAIDGKLCADWVCRTRKVLDREASWGSGVDEHIVRVEVRPADQKQWIVFKTSLYGEEIGFTICDSLEAAQAFADHAIDKDPCIPIEIREVWKDGGVLYREGHETATGSPVGRRVPLPKRTKKKQDHLGLFGRWVIKTMIQEGVGKSYWEPDLSNKGGWLPFIREARKRGLLDKFLDAVKEPEEPWEQ